MQIKSIDMRSTDIVALQSLLEHPRLSADQRRAIEREIRFIKAGVKGESDAAYEIDFKYGKFDNWVTIHDLRLEYNGRVAQIDHILINRALHLFVCESKHFNEGLAINEHGECSAFRDGRPYGIPSPFEQNRRHIAVLRDLARDDVIPVPRRLGLRIEPQYHSIVAVSRNARISRPKKKLDVIDQLVKVDQIDIRIEQIMQKIRSSPMAMARLVSRETMNEFAASMVRLHSPASFDWNARFGLPAEVTAVEAPSNHGSSPCKPSQSHVCARCGSEVEAKVVSFCRFNKKRFSGDIVCRECQPLYA